MYSKYVRERISNILSFFILLEKLSAIFLEDSINSSNFPYKSDIYKINDLFVIEASNKLLLIPIKQILLFLFRLSKL